MKYLMCSIVLASVIAFGETARASIVVSVTANPLWTNTYISVVPSDTVNIYGASGSWSWGGWTGPDGDPAGSSLLWDEWIQNGLHGQLIGFIGPSGLDLNAIPRVILQNEARLFPIGTSSVSLTGKEGVLWLGFNDDYASLAIGDNSGSVTVNVDGGTYDPSGGDGDGDGVVPEPSSVACWLTMLGTVGGLATWRRYRKST